MIVEFIMTMDNPGTYIMMIVIGLVFIPFYLKSIHQHMKNPQEYYMTSFEVKVFIGLLVVGGMIVIGFSNFLRFVPG